jgi:uncharacterized protein
VKVPKTVVFAFVLLLSTFLYPMAGPAAPKGKAALEAFGFKGVTLDGGRLRDQLDAVKKEYLAISDDDLLKGFRKRSGRPAPGADLGGWYGSDTFHVFGQIVGGLSRMFAATGDVACRDKVNRLIEEWGKCLAPDGYFYYSASPNARHYTFDKMVGGLLDAHLYCGNPNALGYLSRITDWAVANLSRERKYAYNDMTGNTEWYTLSENLYRAYLVTGDIKYRDFGAVWEYTDYWNVYARKGDIFSIPTKWYHAYSHVNAINGAAAAYLVSGEPHYLDTLVNAFDYLMARQTYATGGFGPKENLLKDLRALTESLTATTNHFETQCGSWAAFKLVKALVTITGDARYGDWAEALTYNGIGASIPMNPAGEVQYFSDYRLYGGAKINTSLPWSCCSGTRPEAVADYDDLVWFRDATNLYVNLYTPATVRWEREKSPVFVSQSGTLEDGRGIAFTVRTKTPSPFGIKFRVPGWLAGPMTVSVNGKEFPAGPDGRHWLPVERTWSDGDTVLLRIPLDLRAKRLDPGSAYPAAIMYGPVVMAGAISGRAPASRLDMNDLASQLERDPASPATFRLRADKGTALRPFYAFGPGEEYFMYIDPRMMDLERTAYSGPWAAGGDGRYCDQPGAAMECFFTGTGLLWTGSKFDDAGQAEVTIDGKTAAVVDQYDPVRETRFEWKIEGLEHGRHVLRIRILPDKNPASKGRFINIRWLVPIS